MTTDRLQLRPVRLDDGPLLVELDSDPEVMRFVSKGMPTPREHIEREVLPRWLRLQDEHAPFGFFMAHLRGTGAFAGWFHLRPDRLEGGAHELGYRLRRATWGRGLATEGGRALIAAGFGDWGCTRITAHTLEANYASQRVMEKCGLRFEADFLYPPDLLPGWTEDERRAVRYGLCRRDYEP